jgi:hypothetical protein
MTSFKVFFESYWCCKRSLISCDMSSASDFYILVLQFVSECFFFVVCIYDLLTIYVIVFWLF